MSVQRSSEILIWYGI